MSADDPKPRRMAANPTASPSNHDVEHDEHPTCKYDTTFVKPCKPISEFNNPKAAPSLADRIARLLETWPADNIILRADQARETLAALRAVEAVRAFSTERGCCEGNELRCDMCDGYWEGVEAVQALLEGEG